MTLSREKAKDVIWQIFDYIDGTDEYDKYNDCILGHPALYFFHSRDELSNKVDEFLNTKDLFDKYDIYYFVNKMIKFLLKSYDSHTKLLMMKSDWLPIQFKFIDEKVYVIRITEQMKQAQFGELVAINGINIGTYIKEIEAVTCYSTKEFLEFTVQTSINTPNVLKSLPSFNGLSKTITYTVLKDGIKEDFTFDLERIKDYSRYEYTPKQNYSYTIQDGVLILVYNSCSDIDSMKKFVDELKAVIKDECITKFIVDIRGNRGGDSRVIKPLLDFLKGKDIVTLIDEYVFSSGSFACVDLLEIGSYFIGTNISTTLNAFGNVPYLLNLDEFGFGVIKSTKYLCYDDDFNFLSYDKLNFKEKFKNPEYFESLDQKEFHPNEFIYKSLEDYKNDIDSQLVAAIKYLSELDK